MVVETMHVFIRNWWVVALRGVAAFLFGVITLVRPDLTLAALILVFGAFAVANGLFTIWSAVANRRGQSGWVLLVISGVLGIAFGVLTFVTPGVTAIILLYFIAAWAIVTGIGEIATAIRLRKVIEGEWLLIAAGLLSVAFGILLIVAPGAGALAVTLWIGVYALVFGVLLVALAFRLRSWGKAHDAGAARSVA